MLKKYSRPLDMLLASVAAYQTGRQELASKLFVKACAGKGFKEVVAELDRINTQAAETARAKQLSKAMSAARSKVVVKAEGEDDDLGLEDINLEEDADLDGDGDDTDIDTLLDSLDGDNDATEVSEGEGDDDVGLDLSDDEEVSDSLPPVSKSPDKPENLNDEAPKADKNEPARVQAKAKMSNRRAQATAHNLKALARLLNK